MSIEVLASGSGRFIRSNHADWTTVRNGASLTVIIPTGTSPNYLQGVRTDLTATFFMYRSFIFFDTSSVGAGRVIVSAVLSLNVYSKDNDDLVRPNIYITKGYQSDPVVTGDWAGQTAEVTDLGHIDLGDVATGQYNDISLNAAGLAWINKTGITKFCMREDRDLSDEGPLAVSDNGLYYWMTQKGSGYEPKLTIELRVLPDVTTDPATSLEQTTATLNGTLDNDGGEACSCGFEYGKTTEYGTTTATQSKTTGQTFSHEVRGLKPATVYHFRAVATNTEGTSYGDDRTFQTAQAHRALGKAYALSRQEL